MSTAVDEQALSLADRMKGYEDAAKHTLPAQTYTIIRLDGRSFHGYTRSLKRPFDAEFAADMDATAVALATEISGCQLGYVQSDEISLLATDFEGPRTQAWFGGVQAKITSVSAALASATFNRLRPSAGLALFDSRAFTVPTAHEAAAYFLHRQRDCVRNAIQMAARAEFSHKRTLNLNTAQLRDLLTTVGLDFDMYPQEFRQGRLIARHTAVETVTYTDRRTGATCSAEALRSHWRAEPAPLFDTDPDGWLLRSQIPAHPAPAPSTPETT